MCCGHRWPLMDCSHLQLRLPFPRGSKSQGGTGWMRLLPIDFVFSSCQFYGATTPSVHLMCQGWVFLITFFMASFVDPSNSSWLFPPYSMLVCIYSIPHLPRAWEGRGGEGREHREGTGITAGGWSFAKELLEGSLFCFGQSLQGCTLSPGALTSEKSCLNKT